MSALAKVVLITGCSSGIGDATARRLAAGGWTVYATARNVSAIESLAAEGCQTLALDVTDEASMVAAVRAVEDAHGAVGALVSNAAFNVLGAIETVSMETVRSMFETNVFGAARLAQLVLPAMRAKGAGRIVNVSSMNARVTFPGMGYYCSTKHALDAIGDALRYETRTFGIDVVSIQPGFVKTGFGAAAAGRMEDGDGVYADFEAATAESARNYTRAVNFLACSADDVAATIEKALTADRPRSRYRVARSARLFLGARHVLPDAAFDAMLRSQFPSPARRDAG